MSVGSIIDGEPNVACQALALKRALIETVSDAGIKNIDAKTLALLVQPVNLEHMMKFGGGVTSHNSTRVNAGSARVQNFEVAAVENHLADIDRQLKALGGS